MVVRSYYQNRERERLHETLRLLAEKGQPLSGELLDSLKVGATSPSSSTLSPRAPSADLRRGVILVAVALAIAGLGLALKIVGPGEDGGGPLIGVAAFPGFIGLGFIALGVINRDRSKA